jgi:hypothetical protein
MEPKAQAPLPARATPTTSARSSVIPFGRIAAR